MEQTEPQFETEEEMAVWIESRAYVRHFAYARKLLGLAEQAMLKGGAAVQGAAFPQAIALILAKAYKSFYSATLLGRLALTEDMGVLIRSLLNLHIIARWIAFSDTQNRAQRYVQWFWVEMRGLLDLIPAPEDSRKAIEEEYRKRKKLFGIKEKPRRGQTWHGSTIRAMAEEVGLLQHYKIVYHPLSAMEHSSSLSYFGMLSESETPENVTLVKVRSHQFVPYYLQYGFEYLAGVLSLWNREFSAFDPKELEVMVQEAVSFFDEYAQEVQAHLS